MQGGSHVLQLSDPRASDDGVLIPEDIAAVCGVKNIVSIDSCVARLLTRGRLLLCSVPFRLRSILPLLLGYVLFRPVQRGYGHSTTPRTWKWTPLR